MAHPAKPLEPKPEGTDANHPHSIRPLGLPAPLMLNVRDLTANANLSALSAAPRLMDVLATPVPAKQPRGGGRRGKNAAVLRGLKDLQDLQKQTIAVLEAVKSTLDDIQQVLRSPEATRGMEKQRNAAQLLSKGFPREAVEQAHDAVGLLPANPEAYLLLSLSLAANQEYETALGTARKGLALFDRRSHPLAIEAGLLHALASLGCAEEAIDRWSTIIDTLPLPVLFDHLGRIASCFPARAAEVSLDDLVNRRLARDEQNSADADSARPRVGKIDILPNEIPAPALFAGLDAAKDFQLPNTHRAILGQIARRLQTVRESRRTDDPTSDAAGSGGVIKFLTECLIPLGNRNLERTTDALGRTAVKRLLRFHADAATLHRALGKLEMAGAMHAARELSSLLNHWRREGNKVALANLTIKLSWLLEATGAALFTYSIWQSTVTGLITWKFWIGPSFLALGAVLLLIALFNRTWHVQLPYNRPKLSTAERAYLNKPEVRQSLGK